MSGTIKGVRGEGSVLPVVVDGLLGDSDAAKIARATGELDAAAIAELKTARCPWREDIHLGALARVVDTEDGRAVTGIVDGIEIEPSAGWGIVTITMRCPEDANEPKN